METSSQESVDSQLLLIGLDFEPSSSVKSSLTVAECSPSTGHQSRILEISEEQTSLFGEEELMSLAEGSPASRSPLPGSREAQEMNVISGRQCALLSQKSGLFGSFVKTCLESSAWGNSSEFVWIWNRSVTRHNRLLFQLTPLGQNTEDNGCSLLRTATAQHSGPNAHTVSVYTTLDRMKLWPTAHANCSTGAGTQGRDGGLNLQTAAKLWPTPTVPNGGRRNPPGTSITGQKPDGGKAQMDLREFAIRMFPTPRASDYKGSGPEGTQSHEHMLEKGYLCATVADSSSGSLNPRFVEELMGFPIDHTDLKHSETPLSRSKPTRSSKQSPK